MEHIKKHDVGRMEVEEAVKQRIFVDEAKNGRYLVIGSTTAKRLLSVFLSRERNGEYYVVSARDTSRPERRRLYE